MEHDTKASEWWQEMAEAAMARANDWIARSDGLTGKLRDAALFSAETNIEDAKRWLANSRDALACERVQRLVEALDRFRKEAA